jgi:hypothetical protein
MEPVSSGTVERLSQFFAAWQRMRIPDDRGRRLENFLREFAKIRPLSLPARPERELIERPIDLMRFTTFLRNFAPVAKSCAIRGEFINVWAVSGLGRSELRNASVLAWLFNAHQTHGRGAEILRTFMRRLKQQCDGVFPLPDELSDSYSVVSECYPFSSTENRVDLVIEGSNFLAFIEIKIDAPEGVDQIKRYSELAEAMASATAKSHCVIFLTRTRARHLRQKDVLFATWTDISDAIRAVVAPEGGCLTARSFGDRVLLQFANHVRQL